MSALKLSTNPAAFHETTRIDPLKKMAHFTTTLASLSTLVSQQCQAQLLLQSAADPTQADARKPTLSSDARKVGEVNLSAKV